MSSSSFSSPILIPSATPFPSPPPSPSPSMSSHDEVVSISLGSASPGISKGTVELEALKSLHDVDLVVTEDLVRVLRDRYRIPKHYRLHAPFPGQQPYDRFPNGFGLTVGALEAGLWFSVHPVIGDCLYFWGISPSQVSPNSWRYLVAFI